MCVHWEVVAVTGENCVCPIMFGSISVGLSFPSPFRVPVRGWREIYVRMHMETADRLSPVIKFVEQCSPSAVYGSIEARDDYKAVEDMRAMKLGFIDVQMFLFKSNVNVLHNLIGLHYCIFLLQVPMGQVKEALKSFKISERKCCIRWWKLGTWFYGFRMRDEAHLRQVSLEDLITEQGADVRMVLTCCARYEILRVEIFFSNSPFNTLSCRTTEMQQR